eukprot:31558-Pelagococcus_subviridis.AAC.6
MSGGLMNVNLDPNDTSWSSSALTSALTAFASYVTSFSISLSIDLTSFSSSRSRSLASFPTIPANFLASLPTMPKSFAMSFSITYASSASVSRSAIFESFSSGSGLHELSVTTKSENLTPTFLPMAVNSGTYAGSSSGFVEYTTAPPYPSHASFVPL